MEKCGDQWSWIAIGICNAMRGTGSVSPVVMCLVVADAEPAGASNPSWKLALPKLPAIDYTPTSSSHHVELGINGGSIGIAV